MVWSGYEALPPYFGGKRRLVPRIFKEILRIHPPDNCSWLSFVDPFLSGGALSLYAKSRGFGVLCGDLAGEWLDAVHGEPEALPADS